MKKSNIINIFLLIFCITSLSTSCVKYDAEPFSGKILPRATGYTSGVTNDWLYFNLRTGHIFNKKHPNQDIKEGEQLKSMDWDIGFCGYRLRTNSGTSGPGKGGAMDLGYSNYDKWINVTQLPKDQPWVTDTDKDVYITISQADWFRYLAKNKLDAKENPWFDPNKGPQRTLTSANKVLAESMTISGPPMTYTPSYHTYVVRTADGKRYFKIQIVNWYNTYTQIGDTGGEISYYCDEINQ
ncbi:HmuY family protein [Porphyromonas pogonae]|uniref:HmuY family protein n=1 Tax=Porphyromonas pogonae TaxID=867595 RepID=UPI002E766E69|nr:HmuY family protein [Porphyromonas pogonae]